MCLLAAPWITAAQIDAPSHSCCLRKRASKLSLCQLKLLYKPMAVSTLNLPSSQWLTLPTKHSHFTLSFGVMFVCCCTTSSRSTATTSKPGKRQVHTDPASISHLPSLSSVWHTPTETLSAALSHSYLHKKLLAQLFNTVLYNQGWHHDHINALSGNCSWSKWRLCMNVLSLLILTGGRKNIITPNLKKE